MAASPRTDERSKSRDQARLIYALQGGGRRSQLQTACDLQYIKEEQFDALRPQFTEVAKMLSGLRNSLTVNL